MPPQHPYDKWVKTSKKIRENDVTPKTHIKAVSDFFLNSTTESPNGPPNIELRDNGTWIRITPLRLL